MPISFSFSCLPGLSSTAFLALPKNSGVEFPIDISLHVFQYIMGKMISHKNQRVNGDIKAKKHTVKCRVSGAVLEGQAR